MKKEKPWKNWKKDLNSIEILTKTFMKIKFVRNYKIRSNRFILDVEISSTNHFIDLKLNIYKWNAIRMTYNWTRINSATKHKNANWSFNAISYVVIFNLFDWIVCFTSFWIIYLLDRTKLIFYFKCTEKQNIFFYYINWFTVHFTRNLLCLLQWLVIDWMDSSMQRYGYEYCRSAYI